MGKKCDFNREVDKNFSFTYLEKLTPKHCNKPESWSAFPDADKAPALGEENGGVNAVGLFSDRG